MLSIYQRKENLHAGNYDQCRGSTRKCVSADSGR
ncbi:MAG: hypothetical protein [Chaetfec virus UA24_244]|nr:MAG: hypothetical protein [Chaetfec virus UA24_244]